MCRLRFRLARQAARATEADRGRAALLTAVSHDLRAPLAAAKAAVSGLRSCHTRLTAADRAELLATAEAMGGTVEPAETPGGGLTMIICMPAVPGRRPAAAADGTNYVAATTT